MKIDIHSNKETKEQALYNLMTHIKMCKRLKDRVLYVVVGYGSTSGKHIIKTNTLELAEELKQKNQIKDYILGNELDIFNAKYQKFKYKELINEDEKRLQILRTTTNHKIRSLYSRYSDIFNINKLKKMFGIRVHTIWFHFSEVQEKEKLNL